MAKAGVRVAITLACTECKRRNYQTTKSKRNTPDRVEFKKFCRWCGGHTPHRESRYVVAREADLGRGAPPRPQPQPRAVGELEGGGNLLQKLWRFVNESAAELKKVEWPGQNQVIQGTVVVLVACLIVGTYLWLNDQVWKHFVAKVLLGQ